MMPRTSVWFVALALVAATGCARPMATFQPFGVVEVGIPELQKAMTEGRVTSRQLVVEYLTRIALYEDQLKRATGRLTRRR